MEVGESCLDCTQAMARNVDGSFGIVAPLHELSEYAVRLQYVERVEHQGANEQELHENCVCLVQSG